MNTTIIVDSIMSWADQAMVAVLYIWSVNFTFAYHKTSC